ncbi:hypothetical protein F3K02_09165 [Hydrogenophaga sp. D2P1]|uniref:Uncharacterized protein n=1 Tax=Hydrogenophaga aromaticivorans TaxID=2610898 RepID=A0A7Y8GV21_9BURK|nr:hypothetical protein [Hydrogenophaga aromaticivorans]NWF45415.1 hypothetical protein [Hydrogenophaga aromaticivorans]
MSYSSNPVLDAMRHCDALYEASDAQIESEADLAGDFLKACKKVDANALAPWAGQVVDNEQRMALGLDWSAKNLPQRQQALHEVMVESLDYPDGPTMCEAMQLLLNVAYSADLVNTPSMARGLIERMGRSFAFHNSGVE